MLAQLSANDFLPWIGKTCRASADGLSFELVIESVDEKTHQKPPSNVRAPFLILFKSSQEPSFHYGLFTLEMDDNLSIPGIYIERTLPPHGGDPNAAYYQSVFN